MLSCYVCNSILCNPHAKSINTNVANPSLMSKTPILVSTNILNLSFESKRKDKASKTEGIYTSSASGGLTLN